MAAPTTIRMTLTNSLEGKTKVLNNIQFIAGVCLFTGSKTETEGITKYFTTSYQVKVEEVTAKSLKTEAEAEAKPEAIRVDDSDVLSDERIEEDEEAETDPPVPNARQAEIIAAINCIEKDKWVDLESNTPRPKVSDVKEQAKDPTVTVAEIVEVIVTWLS